jgi:hypothetical protein
MAYNGQHKPPKSLTIKGLLGLFRAAFLFAITHHGINKTFWVFSAFPGT